MSEPASDNQAGGLDCKVLQASSSLPVSLG